MERVNCQVIPAGRLRCRGAAIVETVIALPVLLAVILTAIQFGLVYEAKATLNHAVLGAARSGAVSNAQPEAIRRGLARGLAPLYSPGSSLQGVVATVAQISASLPTDARIRILNPTKEAFSDFAEEVAGVREIPNDRLHTRSTAIGADSGLNIQDANILKVEVTYGYELKVPLVNWFISRVLLSVHRGGGTMHAFEQQLLRRMRLPVIAASTVRMQSPARMSELVVSRSELPDLARIPIDARPPKEVTKPGEPGGEGGGGAGGETGGDEGGQHSGSNLGDGFLGFGSGSAAGGGSAGDDGDGEGRGGGNSGNPQSCTNGDGSAGASMPGTSLPSLAVGNPIHVVTGNKYQSETDLGALPGSLGIEFVRHYNSEATDHAGVLGAGWRHSYEASIRIDAAGDAVDLWQADGRHLRFRGRGGGRFIAQLGADGELVAEASGYRWRWPTGRELLFTVDGRLSSISQGAEALVLNYNEARQLASVIDSQQRALGFEYYGNGRLAAVHGMAKAVWRYGYDSTGNLAQSTSADGALHRYSYEDSRHPHHLTGISIGSSPPAKYGQSDALERVATWAYDVKGRGILSSHPADAGRVTLQYGDRHTDVTDAFGRTSRYMTSVRDGVAVVDEVRGPGCDVCGQGDVTYRYDGFFQLTEVNARKAPRMSYEYEEPSPSGAQSGSRSPDHPARLVTIRKDSAVVARYRYEGDATRPSRIELPSIKPGAVHSFHIDYAPNGQPRKIVQSGYAPDSASGFSFIERATSLEYDAAGRVKRVDGPRTDVEDITELSYDAKGRVASVRSADGLELRVLQYDDAGRAVKVSRSYGAGGSERPDGLNRSNRSNRSDGSNRLNIPDRRDDRGFALAYDLAGHVTKVSRLGQGAERSVQYRYDAAGRLIERITPDGREETIAYDEAGRATRFSVVGSDYVDGRFYAPDGQLVLASMSRSNGELPQLLHFSYDAQRRLQEVRDGDGPPLRRYEYRDDDAKPERIIDPLGFATALTYDRFDQPDSMLAPDGGSTRFARDEAGRLTSVAAPNAAEARYAYDDFGRRIREDSPDRGTIRYRYDDADNLVERVDARLERVTYAYDAVNRLIEVTDRQGATRLEYNNGRLASVRGPGSSEGFEYSADGRVLVHSRSIARSSFRSSYGYDPDGRIETQTLPSGARLRYRYTREGVLRSVIQEGWFGNRVLLGAPDDNSGSRTMRRLAFGNRLTDVRSYDPQTNRIARRATDGVLTQRRTIGQHDGRQRFVVDYKYDEAGRIVDSSANGAAGSYEYDPVGRLTNAATALGRFTYRYDANGNRIAASEEVSSSAGISLAVSVPSPPGGSSSADTLSRTDSPKASASVTQYRYESNSNRLLSIEGPTRTDYRYDASGNPTRIGDLRYEYDSGSRPVRLFKGEQLLAEYAYNVWGERIRKTVHGGPKPETTLYIYESHQLLAESDDRGLVQREYLHVDRQPVAMLDHGDAYWIHTDRLGSPLAVTDGDRHVVWNALYEPFGKALVDEDPDGDGRHFVMNLRFPGQYADAESGTHYNYLRTYDPRTGRYLTSDPIGTMGGSNSFAYAGQSPQNAIDPLGLFLFAFDGTWINRSSGVLTNVELFRRYYDPSFDEVNSYYRAGLGTADPNQSNIENSIDKVLGGAFGVGGQEIIDEALDRLDRLIAAKSPKESFDGIIDIVGFSRGAAIGRAFANKLYERIDGGYYTDALRSAGVCRSLRIRFMGLFDTVGSFGIPGDSVDAGYDFRIDNRVGTVAHAIALDEHRAAFDLVSIQSHEGSPDTTPYREERGFMGAHSDIGGGYSTGDLSDLALQWMHKKAIAAGLRMAPLDENRLVVSAPVIHDERTFAQDREIFYPNDPNWRPETCRSNPIQCLLWSPPATQRQSTAPQFQFPELQEMIKVSLQPNAVRGTVDMQRYLSWLRSRGQI